MTRFPEGRQPAPLNPEQIQALRESLFRTLDGRPQEPIIKGIARANILRSFRGDPRLN